MPKKYINVKQKHIYSSPELNFALSIIKQKTDLPYRCIMERLAKPLSEIIHNKGDPAGFCVMVQGDTITIQVYGNGSIVYSGQNQPLSEVLTHE